MKNGMDEEQNKQEKRSEESECQTKDKMIESICECPATRSCLKGGCSGWKDNIVLSEWHSQIQRIREIQHSGRAPIGSDADEKLGFYKMHEGLFELVR